MESKIKQIVEEIERLNSSLSEEYSKLSKKYGYYFNNQRIEFLDSFHKKNKKLKTPIWKYIFPKNFRHFLSIPFIYMMIAPVFILDIFISIYHFVAFPLYGIPKVKRKDYIVYDRKFLSYLNILQKINCLYCSYVNGFLGYAVEIAGRTERYWCPIKAAKKPRFHHGWYKEFADYGNQKEWDEKFNDPKAFKH